jgi:hypothetical protein
MYAGGASERRLMNPPATKPWVGASFIGEDADEVSRVVVVEDTHEFTEVDVRHAGAAADDEHVLVIYAL